MDHRFAFVIPCYNHGAAACGVIKKACLLGYPVIAVDDGSTDDTRDLVKGLPGVKLIRHERNRGKGAALLSGFREAALAADYAITMDADGQHNPGDSASLISALPQKGRPIVVGRRENMLIDRRVPWTSRFGRLFSNFWVRASGGPRLSDTQCGFRLYPLPEVLSLRTLGRRFQFEVEVLTVAAWKGIQLVEAPVSVDYEPPGGRISHFRPFADFLRNSLIFTWLLSCRLLIPGSFRKRIF
jgi:glycosyltransferase involved in cell wall biosynthesis